MSLTDITTVNITTQGRGISRQGFGTTMVAGVHTNFGALSKAYDLGTFNIDMLADGFTTNDPIFLAVQAVARNSPKSKQVIVGKLLTAFNQTWTVTVPVITALGGELYTWVVRSPDGTKTTITYTAIAADTETLIANALTSQLDAISDLSATNVAGVITPVADNPNEMFFSDGMDAARLDYKDLTADSALVAELTAIEAENDDSYALVLSDPNSEARVTAVAAYIETKERIFGYTTNDTDVGAAPATDVMGTLNASQFFRTFGVYSEFQSQYAVATWIGGRLPKDPGGQTWEFKTLSGVTVSKISTDFRNNVKAKKGNYYVFIAGIGVTQGGGVMASGEFIDAIRGRDALVNGLQEDVFELLASADKVPYDNSGAQQVKKVIERSMGRGITTGFLTGDNLVDEDVPFIVNVPDTRTVDPAIKVTRLLPDCNFVAGLAGAIHAVTINGTLQV